MKKYYLFLSLALATLSLHAQKMVIDGQTYNIDTLANHSVGPGTHYTAIRLTGPHQQNVFFLKTDLKNPYIEVKQVLGHDSIYTGETPTNLAKRKTTPGAAYFAGTNGAFYDTGNGYPIGGTMGDCEMAVIPDTWNLFAIDENKIPEIGYMTYNGNVKFGSSTWTVTSFNHTRETNALVLYNRHNGKYTHTNIHGTEALIELLPGNAWGVNKTLHAKVLHIEQGKGNMAIPPGKAVLSGNGTSAANLNLLSVGDEIEINLNLIMDGTNKAPWAQMSAGDNYKTMLKNGVVETASVWNERHPRTAIGYSIARDTLIFCVVDGRSTVSDGVTTKELAQIMQSAGAYTAVNFDGGGSSCMHIDAYGNANSPSGGIQRAVSNCVFLVSSAPSDPKVTKIIPYQSTVSLPVYGEYIPQFYGYNQYGTLIGLDVSNKITLSCPPEIGTVSGNKFIATGTQSGNITATHADGATATIYVDLVNVTKIDILLDSVIIDNRKDYYIEVEGTTNDGEIYPILAESMEWIIQDPSVCKIENGILKALQNGVTTVKGIRDSSSDSIKVKVEIPASGRLLLGDFSHKNWVYFASSQLNATFNTNNLPDSWEHGIAVNFTYGGMVPYIKLTNNQLFTYGLPDTIKVILNVGEVAFNQTQIALKAANSSLTTKNLSLTSNGDNQELVVPVNTWYDPNDFAVYPIRFDNINLFIKAPSTSGKSYTIAVKEIVQIYKGVPVTGISQPQVARFSVYPNPAIGQEIYISLEDEQTQTLQVEIYTLSGQKVQAEILNVRGGEASFTRKNLPTGIYLMKVAGNDRSETIKLIIQ